MKCADSLKPGDIIFCDRIIYKHYGVYAGNGRVIHYATQNGDFGADVRVRETSLKKFAGDGKCMLLPLLNNCAGLKHFSAEETVKRARSRLGEKAYNLLFNNCEHFALWCKYGINKSTQVEQVMATALALGAVAVVTYIAVESDKEG
jgi:uncharacterized protein YfaT (DUF1175 family)